MSEGPTIIRHPNPPGNVIKNQKCPFCDCRFSCSHDLDAHLDAFGRRPHSTRSEEDYDEMSWRPSKYPDCDEILSSKKDEPLKLAIKQNGHVIIGSRKYWLSENEQWIKRKRISGI